jgi:drug/metabolite transporter (DMT)-like permease
MDRRVSAVDLMLLGTVALWALNVTVTRYIVTHGFRPLAYATIRYFGATAIFWALTWHRERSFRVARGDVRLVCLGGVLLFLNQLCFVSAIHETSASSVALILGALPIFTGLIASVFGIERLSGRFWLAAALAFAGVGLVAAGSGGFSRNLGGDALAVGTTVLWAGYAVVIAPLMRRYSPFLISSLILGIGWLPLALVSIPQLADQRYGGFDWAVWLGLAFAIVGPLFLTNLLWYTAIDRVGPSRANLFTNLQPFISVVFALLLLSETLTRWEIVGAVAIAGAIALERFRRRAVVAVAE